jgi:hypothetical protein
VEFVILVPVLLVLLVSMLEIGMAFNDLMTIGYGTREGARAGSAMANGAVASCTGGTDPAGVDKTVIAAIQRILKSPGSDVELSDIDRILIYRATSQGEPAGAVNVWRYTPGAGPDVDPGPGAARLDFSETSHGWDACSRVNSGARPDSIGVRIEYRYRLTTPLAGLIGLIGGTQAATIQFSERTVMALNPTP